jgi:hypothetical protein
MLESFQDRIKINCNSGCWEWLGPLTSGYGRISFNYESIDAHRFSYEHHVGKIPDGMVICHK